MSDIAALKAADVPRDTKRAAQELLSLAKAKTRPGSGYELAKGLPSTVLVHICLHIASRRTGSGTYSETQVQAAACVSSRELKKAIHTVEAALDSDHPQNDLSKKRDVYPANDDALEPSPKHKLLPSRSTPRSSPSKRTANTLDSLCRRYGMQSKCEDQGIDFQTFSEDLVRVETAIKQQQWSKHPWNAEHREVVACAVFAWACKLLDMQTRRIIPQELQVDVSKFQKILDSLSTIESDLGDLLKSRKKVVSNDNSPLPADMSDDGDLQSNSTPAPTPSDKSASNRSMLKRKEPHSDLPSSSSSRSPTKRQKHYQPSQLSENAPMTPSARRENAADYRTSIFISSDKRVAPLAVIPLDEKDDEAKAGSASSSALASSSAKKATTTFQPVPSATTTPVKPKDITTSASSKHTSTPTSSRLRNAPTREKGVECRSISPPRLHHNTPTSAEKINFSLGRVRDKPRRYRPVFPDREFYLQRSLDAPDDKEAEDELARWLEKSQLPIEALCAQ